MLQRRFQNIGIYFVYPRIAKKYGDIIYRPYGPDPRHQVKLANPAWIGHGDVLSLRGLTTAQAGGCAGTDGNHNCIQTPLCQSSSSPQLQCTAYSQTARAPAGKRQWILGTKF